MPITRAADAVRRRVAIVIVPLAVTAIACEDKRVRAIDTGMSRDAAIAAITGGAPVVNADTYPNVHRRSRYIIAAKEMEVLWFTPTGQMPGKDTLPFRQLTPIVLYDGRVIGKGWEFWDSTAKANNITVPPPDSGK